MKNNFMIILLAMVLLLQFVNTSYGVEWVDDVTQVLEENLEPGSILGMGIMYVERPYAGVDGDVYPVPIALSEHRRFFIDTYVGGYYFNDIEKPVRMAVIVAPRFGGYDSGDSDELSGMEDRDWAFDGGLRAKWNNDIVNITLDGLTDLTGTYEGQELRLTFSKQLLEGFLTPRAGIKWQSENLTDYYYGVRPSEVRAGRSEYEPDGAFSYSLGLTVAVPVGEKWAVTGDVEGTFLGDEIKDSPIVDEDMTMRYVLGMVYRF